jgi:hypothetical protein
VLGRGVFPTTAQLEPVQQHGDPPRCQSKAATPESPMRRPDESQCKNRKSERDFFACLYRLPALGSRSTDAETASEAAIGRNRERRSRRSVTSVFFDCNRIYWEIMAEAHFLGK